MTFPVVGSNIPSSYQISNSLRFNDGDNPRLTRTMATGTSRRIFTFSTWLKRSHLGTFQYVFANSPTSSFDAVRINSDDTLDIRFNDNVFTVRTNRVYRDVSSWYHILVAVDTTQSTASDRVKIYTNGSLETSLAGTTYPTQNYDTSFGVSGQEYQVSTNTWNDDQAFDGYLAEVHFIDGQALSPTSFGEFDEDSGVWKPKQYAGTYGTNGFYLKFNNAGNMGEDSSGNDNTFTPTNLSGTTDVTTDTPTNNFATMNPLAVTSAGTATFSEGNCQVATVVVGSMGGYCNINFPSSGKWYCEAKITTSSPSNAYIGVVEYSATDSNSFTNGDSTFYYGNGDKYVNGSTSSYGSAWSQNDINALLSLVFAIP